MWSLTDAVPVRSMKQLFELALQLEPPCRVVSSDFDFARRRVDLRVGFRSGSRFPCPQCGCACQAVEFTDGTWRQPDMMASETGGPGVLLGVLAPLVDLPAVDRPDGLHDLLRRGDERYDKIPFIVDSVADLRSKLLDAAQREQLYGDQVQRWRTHAEQGDMLLRVHALEHALEIARNHGMRTEADELRQELGMIRPDDLGLKDFSGEIEISQEEVDQFLARFDEAPSWYEALRLLAAHGPPGGPPEKLEEQVDAVMAQFPLQFLFPKVLIGPDNATSIFRASGHETHERLAVAEERARQARVWSVFYAAALDRIAARADRPDGATLAEFFTSEAFETEVAERIARALGLFWEGQYDESAHVLVPRLERAFREVARQLGVPVVREPRLSRCSEPSSATFRTRSQIRAGTPISSTYWRIRLA